MSEHHRFQRNAIIAGENAPAADTRPEPSLWDQFAASTRVEVDRVEDVQLLRKAEAYRPVIEALVERGVDRRALHHGAPGVFGIGPQTLGMPDWDKVWREAQRLGIEGLPATREEFEREAYRRNGGRDEDQATLARARGATSVVAQFAGGTAGSLADPINAYTLLFGGWGKTIAERVLTEAALGATVEGLQALDNRRAYARMGEEYGVAEAAQDIALAGVGAGVIRGGVEIAPKIDSAAYRAAAPLRDAIDGRLVTRDVARALAEANPAGTLTPNQQAAVNVLTRAEEIDAASPFVDTYAARDAHAARLAEAMEALDNGRIVPVEREAARLAALAPTRPADVASAAVTGDFDMGRYLARNRVAESGGDDTAAAATSSAYGRYQFVKDTWVEFYKRTFGNTGESRAAILAKRADGAVQDRVMQTFTQANATALREAGVPVSDGTVYLAHFLGLRDAVKVLRATGETPIGSLVSRASVRANRAVFDDVVTAAELVRWADRKMGSRTVAGAAPSPAAGARSAIDDALDAEEILIGVEEARLAGEDSLPVRFEPDPPELKRDLFASDTEWRIEQARLAAEAVGRDPAEDLLYRLRVAVADREAGPSLNRVDELARELGTSPAALREGLHRLADLGELRRTARGRFARLPRAATAREPEDLVRFVARNGGLAYDGLDEGGRKLGTKGHDLRNTGAMARFVPGVGPLLRPSGRSLDEAAELAWEAGYFGSPETTPRPSETDFLQAMDRATRGERVLSSFDAGPAPRTGGPNGGELAAIDEAAAATRWNAMRAQWDSAAENLGLPPLLMSEIEDIVARYADGDGALPPIDLAAMPEDPASLVPYLLDVVSRELDEARADAFFEVEDEYYDLLEAEFRELTDREGRAGGEGGERRAADGRDAGAERARGRARPDDAQDAQLTPAQRDAAEAAGLFGPPAPDEGAARAFDSDAGEGVKAVAESDWHDIRAQAEDPAIAARRRQEAQLRADAPLRGENATGQAQDGEMGLGLFDAADQPTFDLDDGRGPRTVAEIEAELAAERAGIEEMRKCLM